jgi:hypothetical protein
MILKLQFDITENEAHTLRWRARKAKLPLSSYVLAAALHPVDYADIKEMSLRLRMVRLKTLRKQSSQ